MSPYQSWPMALIRGWGACNSIRAFMLRFNPGWLLDIHFSRVSCHFPSRSDFETAHRLFTAGLGHQLIPQTCFVASFR